MLQVLKGVKMNFERTLIIAEAGVNHNGDVNLAIQLCDAAKRAGADIVKFQAWITEKIITTNVAQAEYQTVNTGVAESQYDMLKRLELSQEDFKIIKKHCDEIGIVFASTADECESLDFLISLGIPFIKIGSGEIGNIPYLRYIGSKKMPVILSTGMSGMEDIEISLKALKDGGAEDVTLLHCTTSYPCANNDVNLKAMKSIENRFRVNVGYSDHTKGNDVAVAAVAMGAKILEKHFTLDRNMEGPDHAASLSPEELEAYVRAIRNIEEALGSGEKEPTDVEKNISNVVLKKIVAKRPIKKGAIILEEDICVKRNDQGVSCKMWDKVIGIKATKDYLVDEGIEI